MARVSEGELFSRQTPLIDDATRKALAGVIVAGATAPQLTRTLLWGLGSTGVGSMACDYQGSAIGYHILHQVHPILMDELAPYSRYQPIDPDPEFLAQDLESFTKRCQPRRMTIFAPLNSPGDTFKSLSVLPATLGPVVLMLTTPTGVYTSSCNDVAHALIQVRSIGELPTVPEGPVDMAMLAAGNATYEMTMAQADGNDGNGMSAFYCENQPDPVRRDGGGIRAAFEALAAPPMHEIVS